MSPMRCKHNTASFFFFLRYVLPSARSTQALLLTSTKHISSRWEWVQCEPKAISFSSANHCSGSGSRPPLMIDRKQYECPNALRNIEIPTEWTAPFTARIVKGKYLFLLLYDFFSSHLFLLTGFQARCSQGGISNLSNRTRMLGSRSIFCRHSFTSAKLHHRYGTHWLILKPDHVKT